MDLKDITLREKDTLERFVSAYKSDANITEMVSADRERPFTAVPVVHLISCQFPFTPFLDMATSFFTTA